MNLAEFKLCLNDWEKNQVPFLFIVDFELQKPQAWRLDSIDPSWLLYEFNGIGNAPVFTSNNNRALPIGIHYPDERTYEVKFNRVMEHLLYGDSFLTNLTIKTPIAIDATLRDLFFASHARYKLWLKDSFLVFSPETFIQWREGAVFAFPMKGTIAAALPNAHNTIMNDEKELAEHVTIVDLIRNDLSMIATNVEVKRFRYVEEIKTNMEHLLQVSSEITGKLLPSLRHRLGDAIVSLLPAGSVSGAPKTKTVEVIGEVEHEPRGYYTGICGLFDGSALDSGVMIRFIEQSGNNLFYRSGGGITTQSNARAEYKEAIDKIYVPVN